MAIVQGSIVFHGRASAIFGEAIERTAFVDNYDVRFALEGFVDYHGLPSPPTDYSYACDISADGNYLIVAENFKSPYIRAYRREDEKFVELLVAPFDNMIVSGNSRKTLSLSPDGSYFGVLSYGPPYIAAYMRVGNHSFTKLPTITNDWPGSLYSCAMSNQGEYFAVTRFFGTDIILDIYKRSGAQYIQIESSILEWEGEYSPSRVDTSISADGQYIAVVMENAPYIYTFKREDDEYVRVYPDEIPVFETGDEYYPYSYPVGGTIAPDGSYLAVLYSEAPWICIYKRQGDIFKRLLEPIEPDDLPLGYIASVAFSWDSKYMAFAQFWYPDYVRMYRRAGDSFIRMKDIPEEFYEIISSPYCLGLTYDGNFLLVSGSAYSWDDPQSAVVFKRVVRDSMEEMRGRTLLPPMNSIKHAVGKSVLQGQANMEQKSIKTAVGKITFHSQTILQIVGLALRKLEGLYQITSSEIISRSQPVLSEDLANCIEVWINPAVPASEAEELYRSKEPEEIPPNGTRTFTVEYKKKPAVQVTVDIENPGIHLSIADTKIYGASAVITVANNSSSPQSCTLVVTGLPLEVQGRRKIEVRDEVSIRNHGLVKYVFDSPLVQDEGSARDIGNKILRLFAVARANMEISWRGDPAHELADILEIPEFESRRLGVLRKDRFYITRQEFIADGGLRVNVRGRKLPAQ